MVEVLAHPIHGVQVDRGWGCQRDVGEWIRKMNAGWIPWDLEETSKGIDSKSQTWKDDSSVPLCLPKIVASFKGKTLSPPCL
jgi:hypothetical protein